MIRNTIQAFMLLWFGFGFAAPVHAQTPKVEVRAQVDKPALDPSDTLQLTVSVESEGEVEAAQPTLPPMNDFEVLSSSQSQSIRSTFTTTANGPQFKTVRQTNFNYQLSPRRVGALTIFPVEVVIGGRSYRTKALTVRVASGASPKQVRPQLPPGFEEDEGFTPPVPGGDESDEDLFSQLLRRGLKNMPKGGSRTLPGNPNEAFFIQVESDKTEAYVGEQITVSFYLYTTGIIRDLDTLKYPSLRGFWKEDIEIATHLNFQQEVVNGIPYKKALLASFALFPIKEGTATIDSYQAKCTVIPGADPFGALGMGKAYTFTKSSLPVKVTVKPLPVEGRPTTFSGAVGDFQVTARVEDNSVVANQPFPLKIRFEGRGNAKLIDIPPFQPPEGMELYDTQKEAKFFNWGTSFKEFTLLLIPRREGEFVIPSIGASFFDPQTRKYVNRITEPLRIRVGAGSGNGTQTGSQSFLGAGAKGEAKSGGKSGKPKFEPQWIQAEQPISHTSLAQSVTSVAGLYSLAIAILIGLSWRELGLGRLKPQLNRLLKARAKALMGLASKGNVKLVGSQGVNMISFVLKEVAGDRVSEREVKKLIEGLPPTLQTECGKEIDECLQEFELLAFAPESVLGEKRNEKSMAQLVTRTQGVLTKLINLSGDATSSESQSSGS